MTLIQLVSLPQVPDYIVFRKSLESHKQSRHQSRHQSRLQTRLQTRLQRRLSVQIWLNFEKVLSPPVRSVLFIQVNNNIN